MKKIFLKIWTGILFFVFWPILYFMEKFPSKPNKREQKILDEMRKAKEKDEKETRQKIQIQVNHLPARLQRLLPIGDSLDLHRALRAISLLIKRYIKSHKLELSCVYLQENGNIYFNVFNRFEAPQIPATTTVHEIMRYAETTNEQAVEKLLPWICDVAIYWRKIIPGFGVEQVKWHKINWQDTIIIKLEKDIQ